MPFAFELAGGSWIFLAVVIVFFFAVVYGFWTVRGSGIFLHPFRSQYLGQGGAHQPNRVGPQADRRPVAFSRGTSAGRGFNARGPRS